MKAFTMFIDPGHAWLKVTQDDCAALGLTKYDFSTYSYVGKTGDLYLEEDCDASKFIATYCARHGGIDIRESVTTADSHIRRFARNTKV